MGEPFIGEIRIFANAYAPRGWAFCDGQLLNIGQNTTLFSVISNFYGGDGRITFALPDLRGKAPMHWGRGPGLSPFYISQEGGASEFPLSAYHMPEHTHGTVAYRGAPDTPDPTNAYLGNYQGVFEFNDPPFSMVSMSSEALASAGLSRPHENKQPYTVLNFCIALEGMYPSRS